MELSPAKVETAEGLQALAPSFISKNPSGRIVPMSATSIHQASYGASGRSASHSFIPFG